ncbi:MAG: NAD-dependent epimerase/dehydratase family protein [Chloroflexi bacterium]|nr:NAD-dependent epimerase/dehydratase family protein [Chloroflexota bacterium]
MKIAVTGAFSYSGKYIAKRLLEHGEQVITLTNHPKRPDPFDGKVKAFPLNFDNTDEIIQTLRGVDVLVNTYWVRFDKGSNTQPKAVENTKILVGAAVKAGVKRIVHISITNPSADSHLPYFWGKAANEKAVINSGMSYAILRPTVLFGKEDILINNIAWLLRNLPIFGLPGNGSYKLSPVCVDDLADLAVEAVYKKENYTWDAVGPDEFTFREIVELIGETIGKKRLLIPLPPRLALFAAQFMSIFLNDVMLTPEEVDGLMANLLISKEPPRSRCETSLRKWLKENQETVGRNYASELARHF